MSDRSIKTAILKFKKGHVTESLEFHQFSFFLAAGIVPICSWIDAHPGLNLIATSTSSQNNNQNTLFFLKTIILVLKI